MKKQLLCATLIAALILQGSVSVPAKVWDIAEGQVDPNWDDTADAQGDENTQTEEAPAQPEPQQPAEEAPGQQEERTWTWPKPNIRGLQAICQYDFHEFDYMGENGEVLNYCCLPAALADVLNFVQMTDKTPVDIVDESMPEVRQWEAGSAELLVRASAQYGLNVIAVTRDMEQIKDLLRNHQLMVLHVNGNYPYAASGHYTMAYGYNEEVDKIQICEVVDGQIHEFETEPIQASLQDDGAYVYETPTDSRIVIEPREVHYTGRPMHNNNVKAYGSIAKMTYTYYKDSNCTQPTGTADGARGEGLAPVARGTYYVKVSLPSDGRFTGTEAVSTLTIQ